MSRLIRTICLFAVAGLSGACDLEEDLAGQPCAVADDCWHTQECSRTPDEKFYALPGVCEPEGTECVLGQQLGCQCNPADPVANCTTIALPVQFYYTYPKMVCDPGILRCVLAPQGGQP